MDELKMIADLLTEPPPAGEAVTRGRARLTAVMSAPPARRRLHRRLAAGIVAATAAAAVVLSVGLSEGFGSAQPGGTSTIRTLAFTLTKHADGTATLTISPRVLLQPGALQSDLRQDGIPALVVNGSFCSSDPVPAGFAQVVSGPAGTPPGTLPTVTINPAAMPAGTELSFGIFPYSAGSTDTEIELIDTNSYACSAALPAPPPSGQGVMLLGRGAGMGEPAGS